MKIKNQPYLFIIINQNFVHHHNANVDNVHVDEEFQSHRDTSSVLSNKLNPMKSLLQVHEYSSRIYRLIRIEQQNCLVSSRNDSRTDTRNRSKPRVIDEFDKVDRSIFVGDQQKNLNAMMVNKSERIDDI